VTWRWEYDRCIPTAHDHIIPPFPHLVAHGILGMALIQMVKAMQNAPGTHFNVCTKCSWLNTWHYGRSFPKTTGFPAVHFMSVVHKFTKVLPVIPCGKTIYSHRSVLMAVSLQFCGISWWIGVWEFGLFIFKHLWVLTITLNEDIVKQLKGVSTLCWNLTMANLPWNGPYIKITKLYMFVIDMGVAGLHKYDIGETLWCKVIKGWILHPSSK